MKATDLLVTYRFLEDRAAYLTANDWPVSKWILFARDLLEAGYTVRLYEARNTVSKYLTISDTPSGQPPVKVRFSNHKPGQAREAEADSDFYVGQVNNGPYQTTADARVWVETHFHPNALAELFAPSGNTELVADSVREWNPDIDEAEFLGYMPGDIE